MYNLTVIVHNLLRWVVLIVGFIATLRALMGWLGKKEWQETDRRIGLFFTISVDLQLLLGLILYFVYSPWALKAIMNQGFSYVMTQGEYRFFAIEHGVIMLFAFLFSHFGSSFPKKKENALKKFRTAFIWFGLAFILILAGMPWSRPLFPF